MTLLVDNSQAGIDTYPVGKKIVGAPINLGVARSWNFGIEYARAKRAEFMFVLSTSVVFNDGGLGLHEFVRAVLVASDAGQDVQGIDTQLGWHLHGFRTSVFDVVGTFDEHFWPAYFEDTDMLYRMGLAGLNSPRENGRGWPHLDVDATCERDADTLQSGLVNIEFGRLEAYYVRKWGGKQGEEKFTTPFGLCSLGPYGAYGEHGPIDWKWWP
jgi:hypothetical protein